MEYATSNDWNAFAKLTLSNATLSWSNVMVLIKMAERCKIMATLGQNFSTMATKNNNIGRTGGKQTHTSINYHFPLHTIGYTYGAKTVANKYQEES